MGVMHQEDRCLSTEQVAALLSEACPEYAHLPIQALSHSGTDNGIFRLGEHMALRCPRIESAAEQLKKERQWLPYLAEHLPLPIPMPLFNGEPTEAYPYPWYVYRWIDGDTVYDAPPDSYDALAIQLATWITALQHIDSTHGPLARRGAPLLTQDQAFRAALLELSDQLDMEAAMAVWEHCLHAPEWAKPSVWIHGDLLPSNLVIQHNALHAVIDFGLMGIGDPACDLLPAWCIFDGHSREIFKTKLAVDEATWLRGAGWALSIGVIAIPYYQTTNPVLVSVAWRMVHAVMASVDALT